MTDGKPDDNSSNGKPAINTGDLDLAARLIASNPELANVAPELQGFKKMVDNTLNPSAEKATTTDGNNGNAAAPKPDDAKPDGADPGAPTEEPTGDDDAPKEGEQPSDDKDTPVFIKKTKTVEIKDINDLTQTIDKKYAIKDINTFMGSVDKWRRDAQQTEKLQQQYDEVVNLLSSMPDGLRHAVVAFAEARDWEQELQSHAGRPDFNKPFESNDQEKILKYYHKDKYAELRKKLENEEISETEFDSAVQILYDASKPVYNRDKQEFDNQRERIIKDSEKKQDAFKESVRLSVESLVSEIPVLSERGHKHMLDKVRTRLNGNTLMNLFYDNEGKPKTDAAKRAFYAEFGEEEVHKLTKMIEKLTDSKSNENKFDVSKKKPDVAKGTGDQSSMGVQKNVLDKYISQPKNDPFEHVGKPR